MNVRERLFLISGGNFLQRQAALSGIKKRLLKEASSVLSVFTFYAKEVGLKDLNEISTVSFGQKKIIIFRNFHQLTSPVRKLLYKNIKKILTANYLIFDSDREYYRLQRDKKLAADPLSALIIKRAAVYRVSSPKPQLTIQDLMSSLRKNDLSASLYIVESLFRSGAKVDILGPQIIGILVRKASYFQEQRKNECLEYLWEADRAIKERGIDGRLVVERLLVKIFETSSLRR